MQYACGAAHTTWSPGLDALSGLAELYAGGNPLASLRALRPLHALRGLAALDLAGCPTAALPDCRAHCVFHLAALQARAQFVFVCVGCVVCPLLLQAGRPSQTACIFTNAGAHELSAPLGTAFCA